MVAGTAIAIANAANSVNGNTYINLIKDSPNSSTPATVASPIRIRGTGATTVTSELIGGTTGGIVVNSTDTVYSAGHGIWFGTGNSINAYSYDHPALLDCGRELEQADWNRYNAYGWGIFQSVNDFYNCSCDPTTGYIDFSVKLTVHASGHYRVGSPIANNIFGAGPPSSYWVGNSYNGWELVDLAPSGFQPYEEIVCDIEATGVDRGTIGVFGPDGRLEEWVDCKNALEQEMMGDHAQHYNYCMNIVSGVAVWEPLRNAIYINFGTELWGSPDGNFWLKCSGKVKDCVGR